MVFSSFTGKINPLALLQFVCPSASTEGPGKEQAKGFWRFLTVQYLAIFY
jgi:hypothetical protein